MDDDTARMAPAPQDPNPSNGGGYGKEDKWGDEGGGVMMGGDVLGVGVAPSSFAAMAGGGGPSSSSGGTGMATVADSGGGVVHQQPGDIGMGGGVEDEEGAVGGGGGAEGSVGSGGGNLYLRPVFFGNLSHGCLATDVEKLFLSPPPPPVVEASGGWTTALERPGRPSRSIGWCVRFALIFCLSFSDPFIFPHAKKIHDITPPPPSPSFLQDMKRGFCFVFLKDPPNIEEKRRCEDFIEEINGMYVSRQLLSTTPALGRFHQRSSYFVRTLSWRSIEPSSLPPLRFCLWNFWSASGGLHRDLS